MLHGKRYRIHLDTLSLRMRCLEQRTHGFFCICGLSCSVCNNNFGGEAASQLHRAAMERGVFLILKNDLVAQLEGGGSVTMLSSAWFDSNAMFTISTFLASKRCAVTELKLRRDWADSGPSAFSCPDSVESRSTQKHTQKLPNDNKIDTRRWLSPSILLFPVTGRPLFAAIPTYTPWRRAERTWAAPARPQVAQSRTSHLGMCGGAAWLHSLLMGPCPWTSVLLNHAPWSRSSNLPCGAAA